MDFLGIWNYYVVVLNGMKAALTEFPSFTSKPNQAKKKIIFLVFSFIRDLNQYNSLENGFVSGPILLLSRPAGLKERKTDIEGTSAFE